MVVIKKEFYFGTSSKMGEGCPENQYVVGAEIEQFCNIIYQILALGVVTLSERFECVIEVAQNM